MKKIVLIALLGTATLPAAAVAGGHSVSCSVSSDGTAKCSYTYTW